MPRFFFSQINYCKKGYECIQLLGIQLLGICLRRMQHQIFYFIFIAEFTGMIWFAGRVVGGMHDGLQPRRI